MGEYATYLGQSIKIGTCEEMYYLRADQAHKVYAESGNVDPIRDAESIRFRFPWPSEDSIAPGGFDDYDRKLSIPGMVAPAELAESHHPIQFVAQSHGYNVCLPCPESGTAEHGLKVHRNGFAGAVFLVQQRLVDGQLLPILHCTCGMAWRVPEDESAEIFAALEAAALAERRRSFYDVIAERIRQGYDRDYVAALFGR
jgi:hypothetical protein